MKIGQHFILGFRGPQIPGWLARFAESHGLGGVILFDYDFRNKSYKNNILSTAQLSELCTTVHALPGAPMVFVDQEGGKVRRLKENLGFRPLPSHRDLAQLPVTGRQQILNESFLEMRALGVDVVLAPVVDVDYNPENPDIGAIGRSFSSQVSEVEENAGLFIDAGQSAGLLLCLKHYPGLGGATTNSHEELTDITESIRPEQLDLFYRLASRLPGHAVLVSHGRVRTWDDRFPVSVSPATLLKLREKVDPVVLISDDLQMQGLQRLLTTGEAITQGLAAGLDLVIIGNNLLDEQASCEHYAQSLADKLRQDPELKSAIAQSQARLSHFTRLAAANRKTK